MKRMIQFVCGATSSLLLCGCAMDPGQKVVYEDVCIPSEVDPDLKVRLRWVGADDDHLTIQDIDITYGETDFRIRVLEKVKRLTVAKHGVLVVNDKALRSEKLGEDFGLGSNAPGKHDEWLEENKSRKAK